MGIRSGDHIRWRGGIAQYRRVVPPEYAKPYGKIEETKSLGTRDKAEARRLEKIEDLKFEARIAEIRAARNPHVVAQSFTDQMRVVDGARFVEGGVNLINGLTAANLSPRDENTARTIVLDHYADVLIQQDVLLDLFREVGAVFGKRVEPEVLSRYRSAAVSLARSMVEGAALATPITGPHTLTWSWSRWVAQGKAGEHTKGSEKQAERHWNSFLAHSELVFLGDVRRYHLVDWRDTLIGTGELADNSINQRLQLVFAILRTGWREAELPEPNLRKLKLKVGETDRKPWTRDEVLRALSVLRPKTWQAWLFVIGLTTSVRLGEPVAAMVEWWKPDRGFVEIPKKATKKRKFHAIPLLEFLREPFDKYVNSRPANGYIFDCPRPSDPDEPISNSASRSLNRFLHDKHIERVFHELRDTWIDEARYHSSVKKDIWEIISGHSAATVSDMYGGEKPEVLMAANEDVCRFVTEDAEIRAAVQRLIGE
jgi:integrase